MPPSRFLATNSSVRLTGPRIKTFCSEVLQRIDSKWCTVVAAILRPGGEPGGPARREPLLCNGAGHRPPGRYGGNNSEWIYPATLTCTKGRKGNRRSMRTSFGGEAIPRCTSQQARGDAVGRSICRDGSTGDQRGR